MLITRTIALVCLALAGLTLNAQPMSTATVGGGCFWCTEAIFQQVRGVSRVVSGYSGGHVKNPAYREVCNGTTGHAEVVQITFDPDVITYAELLEIFWKTHDPTTLNRQGNDRGPQYRSIVLAHDAEQRRTAQELKRSLDAADIWDDPIVTEIVDFEVFYEAEVSHQDYYARNKGSNPYCSMVITPKLEKFEKVFEDYLKD